MFQNLVLMTMHVEKISPPFVETEDVPIFGASHSILIRHDKPFDQPADFQEKLGEFESISYNKTSFLRKKREEKLSIQAEFAKVIGLVPAARAWECVPGKSL